MKKLVPVTRKHYLLLQRDPAWSLIIYDNETYIASVAHICIINPPRVFTSGIPMLSIKTNLKLTLYDLYGNSHEATVLYTDVANDICIMKSPGIWGEKVKIS